jgi:hypothetical protein
VSVLTPTDRSSSPVHPTATGAANRCVRYWSMRQNYLLSGTVLKLTKDDAPNEECQ